MVPPWACTPFGGGSLNVYFDDFAYQSFVDQPVAISQPIQY
jgi:hypothetical protein